MPHSKHAPLASLEWGCWVLLLFLDFESVTLSVARGPTTAQLLRAVSSFRPPIRIYPSVIYIYGFLARVRTLAVAGDAAESLTCTVTLNSPLAEGVPLITPEFESVSPAGNCPEVMLQLYGGVPPCAVRVAEYWTFSFASGNEVVVTDKTVGVGEG